MMLGSEAMEEYQRRSDEAVARVMKGQLPVDWDLVDQDADIHDVILDAQYAIAHHFENLQRRFAWFIQIANAHMAPPTAAQGEETTWELGNRSLRLLANALLSDLKKAVNDDLAWRHLAERHAGADRRQLTSILDRLA